MRMLLGICLITLAGVANAQEAEPGFVPLFNGKDLTGWVQRGVGKKTSTEFWAAKDGLLTCTAGTGWLGTKTMYGDFILKLDWKVHKNGNSGVFLRVPETESKESPSVTGFEIQVLDDDGPQYKGKLRPYQYSGGLYHFLGVSEPKYKGVGEWNSYEITCKGDQIQVVFNGTKVIDADISKNKAMQSRPKRGYLGLQNHGHGVEFRNLRIKSLD